MYPRLHPFTVGGVLHHLAQDSDHTDAGSSHVWQQAFYVNDTYWRGAASGAPIFLCVGGEGQQLSAAAVVHSRRCGLVVEALRAVLVDGKMGRPAVDVWVYAGGSGEGLRDVMQQYEGADEGGSDSGDSDDQVGAAGSAERGRKEADRE